MRRASAAIVGHAGGKAVLFTVGTDASPDDYNDAHIDAVLLATGERKKVLDAAAMARSTADGRLLFVRHGVLYVAGFDAARLEITGDPAAVLTGIEGDATTGAGHFSDQCRADTRLCAGAHRERPAAPGLDR